MDIASTFGARRICYLAGRPFWVRPIDWSGWADVAAWLDDMLPGRDGRAGPPRVADDASQALLRSPEGRSLLAWVAVRGDGVPYAEAASLWAGATEEERGRLLSVLMGRRRTLEAPGDREGSDIGELWCGPGLARLAREIGMEALARLTIDQAEWLLSEGECDRHADPARARVRDVQREWEEARRRWERQQAADPAATAAATEGPDPAIASAIARLEAAREARSHGTPTGGEGPA